jgi:hypothetical protein
VSSPAGRFRVAAAIIAVAVGLVHAPGAGAEEATVSPSVSAPAAARPGDVVMVTLTNWPEGVVTVSVCSNGAARGTEDCALAGDAAIAVRDRRPVQVDLTVSLPPGPCPCVVRATTPAGTPVVTAPLVVVGVPTAPIVLPATAAAPEELRVRARVETPHEKFPQSVIAPMGGSVHKVLVVTVRNGSASPTDLHLVAEVGKHDTKEPIGARNARQVQPGETRTIRVPFVVSAPAWGTYHVTGSVYGGAAPVTFTTTTDNDPWALMLMVPVLLVVVAEVLRARERRRRRAETEAPSAVGGGDVPLAAAVPASDAQSSPEVGIPYAGRYEGPSYDPTHHGDEVDARIGIAAAGALTARRVPTGSGGTAVVPTDDVTV